MKIYVDGDACPVISTVEQVAKRHQIPVVIICDTAHCINSNYSEIKIVSCAPDATDIEIAKNIQNGDIVITQDYGVATMALAKGAYALSKTGFQYTDYNIDQLLFERHVARKERKRNKGIIKKSPGMFCSAMCFYDALDDLIMNIA